MPSAGHAASVNIIGTSTSFTGEAFGGSGAGPYTISDTTKNVWDPDTVPTFYDNAVAISAGDILSIDYLFGIVTFTGSKTGPITADGDYYPMYPLQHCHDFSFTVSRDLLEDTAFEDGDAKSRCYGLVDTAGSISVHDDLTQDNDTTGGTRTLATVILSAQDIVLEFQLKGALTESYRFWANLENADDSASVDGLVEGSIDWLGITKEDSAGRVSSFSWQES